MYKQATAGDVIGKIPSILRIRDRIKYDARSMISGMSKEEAKMAYVSFVNNLNLAKDEISCDDREAIANSNIAVKESF